MLSSVLQKSNCRRFLRFLVLKMYGTTETRWNTPFPIKKWRTWEDVRSGKEFNDSGNALGFHIPGAFDKVYHIDECFLQDDLGNRIRNFIFQEAESRGLSFYNIRENRGMLRTLMIRIASTGQVMVCLVLAKTDRKRVSHCLKPLPTDFRNHLITLCCEP